MAINPIPADSPARNKARTTTRSTSTAAASKGSNTPSTAYTTGGAGRTQAANGSYLMGSPIALPPTVTTPSPVPAAGGGGGTNGGGGGGGGAAGGAPAPSFAQAPMADVDWFNSDSTYRNQASGAGADLLDQLSQLLYQRNQGYQQIDNSRRDWTQARGQDQARTGEDFAERGLLSSGLYKESLDRLLADYEKSGNQINEQEQDLGQQYGNRDSLAGGLDRSKLYDSNYTGLADVYGLLGSKGTQAGTSYNDYLSKIRAESAQRAGQGITNTLGW